MMAPLTPISGLSLIIHLLVIAVSSLLSLFVWKKEKKLIESFVVLDTVSRRVFKYGVSILVVISISLVMLTSFMIALTTGIREGSREWHIQRIKHEYAYVREMRIDPLVISFRDWFRDIRFEIGANATMVEEDRQIYQNENDEDAPLIIHID